MRLASLGTFILALCLTHAPTQAGDEAPPSGKCVAVEVLIVDVPGTATGNSNEEPSAAKLLELEKQGKLSGLVRMRLTTLEQQKAMVQLGERVGVATSRAFSGFAARDAAGGRIDSPPQTSYTMQNIGTLLEVSPLVEQDGSIVLTLVLERSRLADVPPSADAERSTFTPGRTLTISARTTLRIPAGKSVVTGGHSSSGKESSQTWIVVTARVLDGK